MECGEMNKTVLQALSEALYKDSNGYIKLNAVISREDCETLSPAISCGDNPDPESLLAGNLVFQDSCGNKAVRMMVASGYDAPAVRTITEDGLLKYSDDILIVNSANPVSVSMVAATGEFHVKTVKNIGVGAVTLNPGLGTIDGAANKVLAQWATTKVLDYDTNVWLIIE